MLSFQTTSFRTNHNPNITTSKFYHEIDLRVIYTSAVEGVFHVVEQMWDSALCLALTLDDSVSESSPLFCVQLFLSPSLPGQRCC